MADISKIINANDCYFGAVSSKGVVANFQYETVHRAEFNPLEFADVYGNKWKYRLYYQQELPSTATTGDVSQPSTTNTTASVYYPASTYGSNVFDSIVWSYSGAGTLSGSLAISENSGSQAELFSIDITTSGPGFINFPGGFNGGTNKDIYVKLFAVSGYVGSLNVINHRLV